MRNEARQSAGSKGGLSEPLSPKGKPKPSARRPEPLLAIPGADQITLIGHVTDFALRLTTPAPEEQPWTEGVS